MISTRELLQRELERRIALNPAYSLGAFAKSLDYDKAALSRIISGKRPVGAKTLARLAKNIDIPTATAEQSFELLSDDVFQSIQGFEHFALLELMQTAGFKSRVSWIARALGISTLKARSAIDRLLRLGLIQKNKAGEYEELGSGWTTSISPDRTDQGRRGLQRELLLKALLALDNVPVTQRDHTSITFAVNDQQIARAKYLIAKFRRKLVKELSAASAPKNTVYNLSFALFPLTTKPTLESPCTD